MTKWMNKPISELHDALARKTVTPLQLVQDCIDGVKADKGNCFEATAFDQALAEAAKIDDVKPEEYLKGIPFLAKDNFSTKGVETTASSDILNGYVPLFDATAISRLKRAGMIMVAKTTMDELAMGGTGTTGHKGNTPNPYDPERIVGGSSCGSAASLAYGIAPLALGSDTGDSVRKPASYSATVGFKATWGRISRFGLFPFATSMDAVGFFTRNVLDAGYVLSALSVAKVCAAPFAVACDVFGLIPERQQRSERAVGNYVYVAALAAVAAVGTAGRFALVRLERIHSVAAVASLDGNSHFIQKYIFICHCKP